MHASLRCMHAWKSINPFFLSAECPENNEYRIFNWKNLRYWLNTDSIDMQTISVGQIKLRNYKF